MRIFDAEPALIADLKDESDLLGHKEMPAVTVLTARHPTLGKLVMIVSRDGSGVVVATEE